GSVRTSARSASACQRARRSTRSSRLSEQAIAFMPGSVKVQVDLKSNSLTIGELARLTNRRASSIRYYEQIGLLPAPERVSGQRRFAPDAVRTLTVIDTAQRAGLTLEEIKPLLGGETETLRAIAERKLPELEA